MFIVKVVWFIMTTATGFTGPVVMLSGLEGAIGLGGGGALGGAPIGVTWAKAKPVKAKRTRKATKNLFIV
jgi:hypothetical protein